MNRPLPPFEPVVVEATPGRLSIIWDRQVHYRLALAGGALEGSLLVSGMFSRTGL